MSDPEMSPDLAARAAAENASFRIHGSEEQRVALFTALAKAKKNFKPLIRSRTNPFFNSKYAELSDIHNAVDEALADQGMALIQPPGRVGEVWEIHTLLTHAAGGYFETIALVPHTGDWQKVGSAQTYCKRYCGGGMVGLAPEDDDDGNATSDAKPREQPRTAPTPPKVERPKPVAQSAHFGWGSSKAVQNPGDQAARQAGPLTGEALEAAKKLDAALAKHVEGIVADPAIPPPPPEPIVNGEPPKKETITYARELVMALGMTKMVPEWCQKLLGVLPPQITSEAQWQVLVADLEQRKADKEMAKP